MNEREELQRLSKIGFKDYMIQSASIKVNFDFMGYDFQVHCPGKFEFEAASVRGIRSEVPHFEGIETMGREMAVLVCTTTSIEGEALALHELPDAPPEAIRKATIAIEYLNESKTHAN